MLSSARSISAVTRRTVARRAALPPTSMIRRRFVQVATNPTFGDLALGEAPSEAFAKQTFKVVNPAQGVTAQEVLLDNTNPTVLVTFPKAFTFVCPTEIKALAEIKATLQKENVRVFAISGDSPEVLEAWSRVAVVDGGIQGLDINLIGDVPRTILGPANTLLKANIPCRANLIFDRKNVLVHASYNLPQVGRNMEELSRLVQAFLHAEKHGSVCPAKWTPANNATMAPTREGLLQFLKKEH